MFLFLFVFYYLFSNLFVVTFLPLLTLVGYTNLICYYLDDSLSLS